MSISAVSLDRVALPALVSQLLADGADVARAEVRLAKAKLTTRLAAVKTAAILLVAAALLAILGLIGLVVGCVMALATLIGPGWAGLVVFAVLIVVAAALGWLGVRQLSTPPRAIVETAS